MVRTITSSSSLGRFRGSGARDLQRNPGARVPIASIGGAGTFDGIYLTGILAVLLAGR